MTTDATLTPLQIRDIMECLPHRYPFLMVDRVLDYKPFEYIKAIKNVSVNEPFFQGHFPGIPVMPGVLITEALAQAGGILVSLSIPEAKSKIFMFTGMDKVRFRKPVYPGDQILLESGGLRHKFNIVKMSCSAKVNGEVVAEADLSAAIVDRTAL